MKAVRFVATVGFLMFTILLFEDNLKSSGFEPNPLISLVILGVHGAFCLGIGHRIGIQTTEKQNTDTKEDSAE